MKHQMFTSGEASNCQSLAHRRSGRRFWGWRLPKRPLPSVLIFGLLVLLVLPVLWLVTYGEYFFSLTHRVPPEVLVVEGWIGQRGMQAAAAEFVRGGYKYVVTTGGKTSDPRVPSSYAETASQELSRLDIPRDRIIVAASGEIEHQRTFNSAIAAWRALQNRGIRPQYVNLLTLGPHARRSQLVYSKVFSPATKVGVIAWVPADYGNTPWWRSVRRTKCLFKEIAGYPLELLLNSGRISNSPG